MKTILIERVANGFLVRPVSDCPQWATSDRGNLFVYRTVEEVAADLPRLMEHEETASATRS